VIEESGQVVEVREGGTAVVLCQKNSMCAHCASADSCLSSADSGSKLVEAANPLGARAGQTVRLSISSRVFLKSSFVVYIVPLIALIVGAVLGQFTATWLDNGIDPNLLAAILGCAFLVGAFLVIRVGSRALRSEGYMPTITAIESAETTVGAGPEHGH